MPNFYRPQAPRDFYKKEQIADILKAMGYKVSSDGEHLRIKLRTNSDYELNFHLSYENVYEPFVIEKIVKSFNERIINDK
jgi:hypothetical protein